MRRLTTTLCIPVFVLSAVLLSPAAMTLAQGLENHYKVYEVPETFVFTGQIVLIDQFGDFQTTFVQLDKFANPVEKNGEPIVFPEHHETWWLIDDPEPARTVELANQFGPQTWLLGDGTYLVLPAAKNQPNPLPPGVANHYKCYEAQGPAVDRPVLLVDQFGTMEAQATIPRYFCNPVEKMIDGIVTPIVDPEMHLACYELVPPMTLNFPLTALDQFGNWPLTAIQTEWLCLPSAKLGVVSTESSPWGRIKSKYR